MCFGGVHKDILNPPYCSAIRHLCWPVLPLKNESDERSGSVPEAGQALTPDELIRDLPSQKRAKACRRIQRTANSCGCGGLQCLEFAVHTVLVGTDTPCCVVRLLLYRCLDCLPTICCVLSAPESRHAVFSAYHPRQNGICTSRKSTAFTIFVPANCLSFSK